MHVTRYTSYPCLPPHPVATKGTLGGQVHSARKVHTFWGNYMAFTPKINKLDTHKKAADRNTGSKIAARQSINRVRTTYFASPLHRTLYGTPPPQWIQQSGAS